MYYEFIGSYVLEENSSIILINKFINKKYRVEGSDINDLKKIIPLLVGSLSLNEIEEISSVSIDQIEKLINELSTLGMLRKREKVQKYFSFISSTYPKESLNCLLQSDPLTNISTFTSKVDCIDIESKMIVAVDDDINSSFFYEINDFSLNTGIPWLKVSIHEPFLYLGPIFSPDGGPCYQCLLDRIELNRKNDKITYLNSLGSFSFTNYLPLERELIKIYKSNFPTRLFNLEFSFNINTLEISSNMVLKNPNCTQCELEGMLI